MKGSWLTNFWILVFLILPIMTACAESTQPQQIIPTPPPPTQQPELLPTDPPSDVVPETPVVESEGAKVLQSGINRDITPDVSTDDLAALSAGNRAFAIDFYHAVDGQSGNLFFSPYSLSAALAMTFAGARDQTAGQMAETLHFVLPPERLHPGFNALELGLTGEPSAQETEKPFALHIANSLWGQQDYPFLPEFIDLLALNYGAGLRLVDFLTAPEPARQEINQWVERHTEERIQDLIPDGAIDSATTLVLANAIYFKADWASPFNPDRTLDAPFNLIDGDTINVPMMSFAEPIVMDYYSGPGYQAASLPYIGGSASMLILAPDIGNFEAFETGLDMEELDAIQAGLSPQIVDFSMPKFSFESAYNLAEALSGMGMPAAFNPGQANFSGMDGTRSLYIGDVFHKAFVAVDEKGTEAAAATAVVMQRSAVMMPDVQLIVDRPFIFIIYDKTSGTALFMGRVLNPLTKGG